MTRQMLLIPAVALTVSGCALTVSGNETFLDPPAYASLVKKAAVWQPTRIAEMNLRQGPAGDGAFGPLATVRCTFVDEKPSGVTPKFKCRLPDGDDLKVKYGRDNGEVYAEVAATRLLWALGFGADAMYAVRVECEGCPPALAEGDAGATIVAPGVMRFEYAAAERKMPGVELDGPNGPGWSWENLDRIGDDAGPDALAHRDALKLLAVMLQHTDSKRAQQRLMCLGTQRRGANAAECDRPFLLVSDLGKTFGKANALNRDTAGAVNLQEWSATPVWVGESGCTGNLSASFTGTLDNPKISEAGRQFLADLLTQLSDAQLHDLFEGARFPARAAGTPRTGDAGAWVAAFKDKVHQVLQRSCPTHEAQQ